MLRFVRVRLTVNLTEDLVGRIRERASLEDRSLSNMLERLISLGLGTVVTERDGSVGVATDPETSGGRLRGTADEAPAPSRSVTAVCSHEHFHRAGVFCKHCGVTP